jgi:hypothetical protein
MAPKVYNSSVDGHRAWAILWDGSEEAALAIKTMTLGRAVRNKRGVMGHIEGATTHHIPQGHWIVWHYNVVSMSPSQFELTYTEVPAAPSIITPPEAT